MDSILISSELLLKDKRDDFGFQDPLYRKELELLKKKRLKELTTIGDISSVVASGATPLGSVYYDEGVNFLRVQNITNEGLVLHKHLHVSKEFAESIKRSKIENGDILMTIVGATIGKNCVVENITEEYVSNQAIARIKFKKGLNPYFVSAFFKSRFGIAQIMMYKRPIAQGNLNYKELKSVIIPFLDIKEQDKVAYLLQLAYFLRKQKIKQAQEELNKINDYIFKELNIDLKKIEDEKSFHIKISQLSDRDDYGYYDKRVENLIKKIRNMKNNKLGKLSSLIYRYPTFYGLKYQDEGIWVIKGENIVDSQIKELDEEDYITQEDSNRFPKTILKENDIVMSVRGTIGKCAVVPRRLENKSIINANMIRIVINNEEVIPAYVHIFLTCSMGQMFLERQSTKAVQSTITVPYIEDIDVPLPSKETQENIINFVQKARSLNKEKLKQSDELIEESKQIIEKIIIGEPLTKQEEQFCDELIQEAKQLGFKE